MSKVTVRLVDETALGQRLNHDVQNNDRADFQLYLALLDERVETQPWFAGKPADQAPAIDWRVHFQLPAPAVLQQDAPADSSWLNACLCEGGSMSDIRLALALTPPPLKGINPLLEPDVYLNLSARARARLTNGEWINDEQKSEHVDPQLMLSVLTELNQGSEPRLHWAA
jgi:hypothetical protein